MNFKISIKALKFVSWFLPIMPIKSVYKLSLTNIGPAIFSQFQVIFIFNMQSFNVLTDVTNQNIEYNWV